MIEATCSACGTINRVADGDVPAGAKFLACSSCKSRVVLPGAKTGSLPKMPVPKAAMIPPPAVPRPPPIPKAEIADLPVPKRQGPLSGMESSKPAPKSGLDLADLPAPKSAKPSAALDLDNLLPPNLPAPKGPSRTAGIVDLPAPKGPSKPVAAPRGPAEAPKPKSPGIVDLPAPKGPAGITDLPAPKGPSARPNVATPPAGSGELPEIVDLPAPKGGIVDLPTPKHGANVDLPAPKGFFDDLPQPAAASKQAKADLPAPKGFFDDLPQPAKATAPALPAPKGFFDDLPQPSKTIPPTTRPLPEAAALPAPKGFFDDDPPPTVANRPASSTAPPASRGVFDDLPEPTAKAETGADLLGAGAHELDLSPSNAAQLELDPGPSGGVNELDLGLPPSTLPQSEFGDLDLSSPSAQQPPVVKAGINIKSTSSAATKPKLGASGDHSALSALSRGGSGDLNLDLEDEPARVSQTAALQRTPAKQKAAAISADKLAKKAKRKKIVLGVVLGLAVAGGGGGFAYKRHAATVQREAAIVEHLTSARSAIHGDVPAHWNRASTEAASVLEVDSGNVEALGLRAEALLGGALDNGVGGEARIAQGRKLLADALEQGVTGQQLESAQALGMIAANQAERAVTKLDAMTKRDPKNGFWLLYLGWAQIAKNDPTSALKSFDAAIAADPKTKLPALYARGRAKLQLVDLEGAKADFAAVLDLQKDHIGAQVGLAASLPTSQSSQREADLLAILARKDISTGDPRAVVQAWTLAGETARAGGRLDVARERYRQALTLSKLDVPALVGLARVELRDSKLAIAADLVQKALSQNADSAEANLVAADLYIRQGKINDALAITQKLAGRVPPLPPLQRASLQLVVGNLLEAQGKDDDAIDAWIEGSKLAGDLDLTPMMTAVTKLGVLAKKAEQNHDAKRATDYRARADELLSSLADRATDDPQLSKTLGAAYLGADDPVKAEHFLRRAVDMRGTDIETHLELAKALAKLDRTDDALEQLRASQQLDQTRLDIALEIARTLEGAKRDDAATEAYTKLVSAKDASVQARVHAGRFFARKGDLKRAAEQAEPILAAEPENAAGHYLRGEGLILTGKLDDARKELTMAVDGDPDPQYLDAQGRAAEASVTATGDTKYYDLAIRAYERASDADPTLLNPQAGMGRVYVARKEWTKAAVPLAAAIKLDKMNTEVMYNLGLTYKNLGHIAEAVEWLEAATKGQQDADTYWQLAQLYQDANNGAKTEHMLREATRLGRDKETKTAAKVDWLTDAWYRLGQTEYDLHNYPAARTAYEAFVGRNPPADQRLKEARQKLTTELKSP